MSFKTSNVSSLVSFVSLPDSKSNLLGMEE